MGASKNSLEKWWTLQMATLATPSAMESLSVSETEQKLDEALTLRYGPLPEKEKKGKERKAEKLPRLNPRLERHFLLPTLRAWTTPPCFSTSPASGNLTSAAWK